MNAKEARVLVVTSRLHGGAIPYLAMYREDIIESVIKEARPGWLFGWLSVCPLTQAAQALGATEYRETEAFKLLSAYHCVNYYSIPREIRRRIPELIREALKGGAK